MRPRANFIPGLESLRGFAALTVCLFHAATTPFMGQAVVTKGSPFWALLNGHGAVVLFFVLSGYVLRLSLWRKIEDTAGLVVHDFLIARFFRLFPVIIATVLLLAAIEWLIHGRPLPLELIARNALLLDVTINGPFWTLQVEVVGCALIIVAFLIERRFGVWAVALLAALLIPTAFGGAGWIVGSIPTMLLHTFLVGYLAAALRLEFRSPSAASMAVAFGLLGFYGATQLGWSVMKGWLLILTELSACALVVAVASRSRATSITHWPAARLLGMVSYSFYALHPIGLGVALFAAGALPAVPRPVAALVVFTVAVAATLAVTAPMYYFVERVGISLGRAVINRARQRVSA